jgi:hypothetical protein
LFLFALCSVSHQSSLCFSSIIDLIILIPCSISHHSFLSFSSLLQYPSFKFTLFLIALLSFSHLYSICLSSFWTLFLFVSRYVYHRSSFFVMFLNIISCFLQCISVESLSLFVSFMSFHLSLLIFLF